MKELMRASNEDEWHIKELQNCILNIAKYINDFCEKYNIDYCLMGGSALGAVRHGGFIPWDDDLDLFMTPDNYEKFREEFKKHGDKNLYYLQEIGGKNGLIKRAKLRLNNTYYIEEMTKDWDIHQGVFVDIMIQHNYPNNAFKRYWMLFWVNVVYILSAANLNYKRRGLMINLSLKLLKILPIRAISNYGVTQLWRFRNSAGDNYFHYYMRYPLPHSVYPKSLFNSYKAVDFENVKLKVPAGVHEYLKILFGDYMKIPDIEKIRRAQHSTSWSVTEGLVAKEKGYKDEKRYF